MQRVLPVLQRLGRHTDLALAALAILVIALMVLPLPLVVIDSLIAVNLASAIALLTFAMYVPSPLALSTFPSLVLLTTLFRVALDIAITRPILLHAQGGDIIATFGKFVVGGNVIVGLVVFSIITIVQFIVVAKGAERVAEVSARFTLDALPGKQLSIDADLRAGIIDEEEARRKRSELTEESQMHGSMDGAMKFIKGDVIAGICIVLINLIGGISIGVILRDMDFSRATQTYAILSVGQGLVSQIPSLLVSLAAGIIVTRSGANKTHLADSIATEVRAQPKALYVTGMLTLLFVLVPGFPKAAFLLCGAAIALVGWVLVREHEQNSGGDALPVAALAREGARSADPPMIAKDGGPSYAALTLELSDAIVKHLDATTLNGAIKGMRQRLVDDLGLPFPGMKLRRRASYTPGQWTLMLFEEPVRRGQIDVPGDAAGTGGPAGKGKAAAIDPAVAKATVETLMKEIEPVLRRHASRLVGVQETQALVTACRVDYPDLVQLALQVAPISRISEVLRSLLAEGVPIRNMRDILECMVEHAPREKDDALLAERCRTTLKHAIARQVSDANGQVQAIMLEGSSEEAIRRALKNTPSGPVIALPGDQLRRFAESLQNLAMQAQQQGIARPALVVTGDLRRHLRRLLELPLPQMPVVAFSEIPHDAPVQTIGTVSI